MSSSPVSSPLNLLSSGGNSVLGKNSDQTVPTSSVEVAQTPPTHTTKRKRSSSAPESESPVSRQVRLEYEQRLRGFGIFTSPISENSVDHINDQFFKTLANILGVEHKTSVSLGLLDKRIKTIKTTGHSRAYVAEIEKVYLELQIAGDTFNNIVQRMFVMLKQDDSSTPSESPIPETQLAGAKWGDDLPGFDWESQENEL